MFEEKSGPTGLGYVTTATRYRHRTPFGCAKDSRPHPARPKSDGLRTPIKTRTILKFMDKPTLPDQQNGGGGLSPSTDDK